MEIINGIEYVSMAACFLETDDYCRPPKFETQEEYRFLRMIEVVKSEEQRLVMVTVHDDEEDRNFSFELDSGVFLDVAIEFPNEEGDQISDMESMLQEHEMTEEEYYEHLYLREREGS